MRGSGSSGVEAAPVAPSSGRRPETDAPAPPAVSGAEAKSLRAAALRFVVDTKGSLGEGDGGELATGAKASCCIGWP